MKRSLVLFALALSFAACQQSESPIVPRPKKRAVKVDPSKVVGTDVGNLMPTYTAKNLDDSTFDLAQWRGRVVLLNVWATWCGPCRAETPVLNELQKTYADRGLKVVGVSVDESGVDNVKEFVTTEHVNYAIAHDPEGRIANIMQTTVLPTSVLLDRTGHIAWRDAGLLVKGNPGLTTAIEKALGK